MIGIFVRIVELLATLPILRLFLNTNDWYLVKDPLKQYGCHWCQAEGVPLEKAAQVRKIIEVTSHTAGFSAFGVLAKGYILITSVAGICPFCQECVDGEKRKTVKRLRTTPAKKEINRSEERTTTGEDPIAKINPIIATTAPITLNASRYLNTEGCTSTHASAHKAIPFSRSVVDQVQKLGSEAPKVPSGNGTSKPTSKASRRSKVASSTDEPVTRLKKSGTKSSKSKATKTPEPTQTHSTKYVLSGLKASFSISGAGVSLNSFTCGNITCETGSPERETTSPRSSSGSSSSENVSPEIHQPESFATNVAPSSVSSKSVNAMSESSEREPVTTASAEVDSLPLVDDEIKPAPPKTSALIPTVVETSISAPFVPAIRLPPPPPPVRSIDDPFDQHDFNAFWKHYTAVNGIQKRKENPSDSNDNWKSRHGRRRKGGDLSWL